MQTVTILRVLWRHRLLSLIVVALAVVCGLLVVYRVGLPPTKLESRKHEVGVSSARILVDTPASQVVDVAPKGSDTLGIRANLLANLMVDGELKTIIARRAGLRPELLVGIGDTVAAPVDPGTTPDPSRSVLSSRVVTTSDGSWLPIIEVDTEAPTAQGAERLARAAVDGLHEYLDSKAASARVRDASRLRISGLGVSPGRMESRGPRMLYALAAMIVVALLGLSAIVAVTTLVRNFRASSPDPADEAALDAESAESAEVGEGAVALHPRAAAAAGGGAPTAAPRDGLRERAS